MTNRFSGSRAPSLEPLDARSDSPVAPGVDPALMGDGITVSQLFRALRENLPLFFIVAGLTFAATALLVLAASPQYSARAVVRSASERRTLTSGVEDAPETQDRAIDPILSAVQVLTSRRLVGAVVDSLGLRLQPTSSFTPGAPFVGRALPAGTLQRATIDSSAPVDTLLLQFSDDTVVAWSRWEEVKAAYGEPLRLRSVEFAIAHAPPVGYTTAVVRARDVTIDDALERLKVVPRPGTDVIDLKYVDSDPATAQDFVNRLARLFQTANGHSAQDQARRRREFLGDQLRVTDSLLIDAESGLSHFRSAQHMASSRDNLSAEQTAAAALEARQGELVGDRRVFGALLQRAKESPEAGSRALAYSPEVAADPILAHLQQRLIDYRTRLDSLTTGPWRSLATHPDVIQLTTLLQTTQDELIRAVRARVASIDARIAVLSSQRASGAESMQGLPAKQAAEATLDRRVEVLRTTADALRQEYQKARISEALGAADIEILDPAPLPYRETGVARSIKLMLGLLLGVLFGGAAAVLAEATNGAVRRPEDLHELIGATELGIIPRIERLRDNGLTTPRLLPANQQNGNGHASNGHHSSEVLFSPSGALSLEEEAFRMLRISLAFSWGDRPCTLVVTSAGPREGKTLIATNLAATFARGGARVLLVDCDIHRPRLHNVFHVSRAPGLMDLLRRDGVRANRTDLQHRLGAVRSTAIDRLSFLPCGADPQTTPELLEPATLRGLLHDLRAEFDVIVLDTPPVLVSADAATLAASADGVVLVVRAGQTHKGAAELARQRVTSAGGRVFGAVLNDPDGLVADFGKSYYAYAYPATAD